MTQRQNNLATLAKICSNNNITPERGNYAGFLQKICVGHMGLDLRKTKEHTSALTIMWRANKWSNLLTPEQQDETVEGSTGLQANKIQIQAQDTYTRKTLHEAIVEITAAAQAQTEPVKKVEAKQNLQQDTLTNQQIAQVFYNTAKTDTYNGVGRIILSEARDAADNKHLTVYDVQQIWRENYPLIDAETKSNVLLIYWNGKDATRSTYQPIIQKKTPLFNPKQQPEGDITEDNEGVVKAEN